MDRKSFLATSALGLGMSGLSLSGLAVNPKDVPSNPSDLKITDIRGMVIASNYDYPIIKIYTNQGVTGLGEVRDAGWIAQALMMKPYLIGKNPLDIEPILKSIYHLTGNSRYGGGYSAIDIALMDIAGKVLGVPCWQLLGRKVNDKIECYSDTPAANTYEKQAILIKRRMDVGFKHFKMDLRPRLFDGIEGCTVGGLPTLKGLEVWGESILKIRDQIGYDVKLGADHFGRLDVNTGIALGEFMTDSKYGLAYLEDVVNFSQFNSVGINQQITAGSPTPTLGFEDLFGLEGFRPFIDNKAIDIIHPDLLTSGGILETKKIADYAAIFGIKTMMHNAGSPIGTMAMVHTAATNRNFIALENHALEIPWWQDLITGIEKPILQYGGYINVPDSPGLGIELNEEVAREHMREAKYLAYNPGVFEPTPEFDEKMSMREAREKRIIGGYHQSGGPWWHINTDNVYGNQTDPEQQ
ncbi:MAG TPA: mandelate racemase/muconate lactonizing enzyme family protein [Draconibacterium sp.]|nr:mandelate racemase/muconate lactonizing enzyme family protein [Draconibacterium sp.]